MDKLNKHDIKKWGGFTLVELSVVLAIVAVLVIGSATLFKEQKVNVEHDLSEGNLKTVKMALLSFVKKNNYLPCPDASSKGDAGFGISNRELEQSASFAAIPATFGQPAQAATASSPFIPAVPAIPAQPAKTVNVDTCSVHVGTVPFKMIGLSLKDVTDEKHNLFRYAVNQGVTVASNIANCPEDSACFFNRNSSPAFGYTTEPVAGRLGVNNLRVCSEMNCSGVNLLADGLIAVVLAYNENVSGLSAEERENLDNDKTFIKKKYVREEGSTYFDDQLVSISGSELKRGERKIFQINRVVSGGGGSPPSSPDIADIDDLGAGSSGTNNMRDVAKWDRVNDTFDFGEGAANREIVLTYDTYAVGSWDQPPTSSSTITSDTGTVSSNGGVKKTYKYDYTDDTQTGLVDISFVTDKAVNLMSIDENGDVIVLSFAEGEMVNITVDYWRESTELILQADENGEIDLEFAVGTTGTFETIDFTNIKLVYYKTPPPIPSFPSVEPISGITQTEGL